MKKRSKNTRGVNPNYHYNYNREFVDYDYVDELTEEEAEWLSNFSDNYYGARFKADDSKNVDKNRAACYKAARQRRRCFMSARNKSRTLLATETGELMDIVMSKQVFSSPKLEKGKTKRETSDE